MSDELRELIERLRDGDDLSSRIEAADLIQSLSERIAVLERHLRLAADIWLAHKAGEFDADTAVGKMVDEAHAPFRASLIKEGSDAK